MAKVTRVDRNLCIGCGNCTVVCPALNSIMRATKVINEAGNATLIMPYLHVQ